jgi:cytochrome c551/c552
VIAVAKEKEEPGAAPEATSPQPAPPGPTPPPAPARGDPAAGKALFEQNGCGSCHTYAPAGSSGKVGPDLDNLASDAQKAGKPRDAYAHESIADPNAYVVPGFPEGVMPTFQLSAAQLDDLVAFLTQKS